MANKEGSEQPWEGEEYAANKLLERPPDRQHMERWTAIIRTRKRSAPKGEELPLLLFRLSHELFAAKTRLFAEVTEWRPYHTIPHRSNALLLGLVNWRGLLRLCFSLHYLLEIPPPPMESRKSARQRRLLVLEGEHSHFLFPVEEVLGVYRFEQSILEKIPVTLAKSHANYLKGMLNWNEKYLGVIDEVRLLQTIKSSLEG